MFLSKGDQKDGDVPKSPFSNSQPLSPGGLFICAKPLADTHSISLDIQAAFAIVAVFDRAHSQT